MNAEQARNTTNEALENRYLEHFFPIYNAISKAAKRGDSMVDVPIEKSAVSYVSSVLRSQGYIILSTGDSRYGIFW